jgi:hypothetical protein
MDESLVTRAGDLVREHGLRGYDAVHLAAASAWQYKIGMEIVLATFVRELWEAGMHAALEVWSEN